MKAAWSILLGLAVALCFVVGAQGDDKKEETLKGTITCAKCGLNIEKKCQTVVQVKDGDKEVNYYFDKDSNKKHHKETCQEAKKGTVTGTVTEKDGKKWVNVIKVEYD